MDKIFTAFASVLTKLTLKRVLLFGLLVLVSIAGYVAYTGVDKIAARLLPSVVGPLPFMSLSEESQLAAHAFMKKYNGTASYFTALRLDHPKNTRVPIFRIFNDDDVRVIVMQRLKGGDGALPMFIKDDISNNNQMITIVQGEMVCDPFDAGGLSRVWPDLTTKLTRSCRVPIPPGFGGVRGYIVVHFKGPPMRPYEWDAMRIDLMNLAVKIHVIESR
jgi:hypothetical protein